MANETSGKKGEKLARMDLIPPYPLWLLAEVYGRGASKYADRNWERGVHFHKLYGAMERHAKQFWGGEDIDPVDGQHHLASVAWMAFALLELGRTHPELDDRPHLTLDHEPQSLSSDVTNQEEIDAAKDEVTGPVHKPEFGSVTKPEHPPANPSNGPRDPRKPSKWGAGA